MSHYGIRRMSLTGTDSTEPSGCTATAPRHGRKFPHLPATDAGPAISVHRAVAVPVADRGTGPDGAWLPPVGQVETRSGRLPPHAGFRLSGDLSRRRCTKFRLVRTLLHLPVNAGPSAGALRRGPDLFPAFARLWTPGRHSDVDRRNGGNILACGACPSRRRCEDLAPCQPPTGTAHLSTDLPNGFAKAAPAPYIVCCAATGPACGRTGARGRQAR